MPRNPSRKPKASKVDDEPAQTTEPVSSLQTNIRQAASEVARRFPPMTAEQAAVVRRALRKQHH